MIPPIQYPQSEWMPPGAGEVSQLMMANAGSSAYQATWGYGDVLGHYLNTNAILPAGYTRKQYNEERAMAAQEMLLSPLESVGELVSGIAGWHVGYELLPRLPGMGLVNDMWSKGFTTAGKAVGWGGGKLFGFAANTATRIGGGLIDTISTGLTGRSTGIDWKQAGASISGGINYLLPKAGGTIGNISGMFTLPSFMLAGELSGQGQNYVRSFWDEYKLNNDIRREMIAKSDRILRFGSASSGMGIEGGMTAAQRDRTVDMIDRMAEDYARRSSVMGGGKYSFYGRTAYTERIKELKSMLSVGTDMGMFDMSKSIDDFEKKFKETVKVVEKLSKLIQKSKGEVMALVGSIQQNEGIYNLGTISDNIMHKYRAAAATGTDLSTVMMESQAGVKLGQQYGFNSVFSSRAMTDSRLLMGRAIRSGELSREDLFRLGGEPGAVTALANARMQMFGDQAVQAELAMGVYYDDNGVKHFDRSRLRAAASGDSAVLAEQEQSRTNFVNNFSRNWRQNGRIMRGGAFQAAMPDVQEMIQNGEISDSDLYSVLISQVQNRHNRFNPGARALTRDGALREAMAQYGFDPKIRAILAKGLNGGYDAMEYDEKAAAARSARQKVADQRISFTEAFEGYTLGIATIGFNTLFNTEGPRSIEDYLVRRGHSRAAVDKFFKGYSDADIDIQKLSLTSADIKYRLRKEKGFVSDNINDMASVQNWINRGSMDAATKKDSGLQKVMAQASRANAKEEGSMEALVNTSFMSFDKDTAKYKDMLDIMYKAGKGESINLTSEEDLKNYSYVLGQVMSNADGSVDATNFIKKITGNVTYKGETIKSLQSGDTAKFMNDRDRLAKIADSDYGFWGNATKAAVTVLGYTGAGAAGGTAAGYLTGKVLEAELAKSTANYWVQGVNALFGTNIALTDDRIGKKGFVGFAGSLMNDIGTGLTAAGHGYIGGALKIGGGVLSNLGRVNAVKNTVSWLFDASTWVTQRTTKAGGVIGGLSGLVVGLYKGAKNIGRALGSNLALDVNNPIENLILSSDAAASTSLGYDWFGADMQLFDDGEGSGYDWDETKDLINFMKDANNGISEEEKDILADAFKRIGEHGENALSYEERDKALLIADKIGAKGTRSYLKDMLRRKLSDAGRKNATALGGFFQFFSKSTEKVRQAAQASFFKKIDALKDKKAEDLTEDEKGFLDWYSAGGGKAFDNYYMVSADEAYATFSKALAGSADERSKRALMSRLGIQDSAVADIFLKDDVDLDYIKEHAQDYGLNSEAIKDKNLEQIRKDIHFEKWANSIMKEGAPESGSDVAATTKDGKGGEKLTAAAMEKFYQGSLLLNNVTVKLMGL